MTEGWVHLKQCREDHPVPGVCRGHNGRPIIIQPDGKKTLQYARASSCGDSLDDKSNLIDWSCANVLRGALKVPSLLRQFEEVDDGWVAQESKDAAKKLIAQLKVIGGAETKANKGTLRHDWSERIDRGDDLSAMPAEIETDMAAYQWATEGFEHLVIEEFCVLDQLRLAGTPDRISRVPIPDPDGVVATRIVDLKTGKVSFPQKMTAQLAVYSRAVRYHQYPDGTAARSPFPDVDQRWGVIIHLPAEAATAELFWINLEEGWKALTDTVPVIKSWRSRKDLLVPFV